MQEIRKLLKGAAPALLHTLQVISKRFHFNLRGFQWKYPLCLTFARRFFIRRWFVVGGGEGAEFVAESHAGKAE